MKNAKKDLESIIVRLLKTKNPVKKAVLSASVGCFPGRIQKNFALKSNINNILQFTYYSIAVGTFYTLLQYAAGDSIDNIPILKYLGHGGKAMGIYGFVNETIRCAYTLITHKPIGSLVLEIPDRVMNSAFLLNMYIKITQKFY